MGKDWVTTGLEFTFSVHGQQFLKILLVSFGFFLAETAEKYAYHRGALQQGQIGLVFRNSATGETYNQQPAVPVDTASALIEKVTAHWIINNVGAPGRQSALSLFP